MRVSEFCVPVVAASMLLATAGCSVDSSANQPGGYAGAAAATAPAAVAPAAFPPEAPSGQTMGLDAAAAQRRQSE